MNDLPYKMDQTEENINSESADGHVIAVLKQLGKQNSSNGTLNNTFLFYLYKKSPIPLGWLFK